MGFKCGIVGLPNVGKSTLFNALTAVGAPASNYPFCTIEPNVGRVDVPDERLQKLDTFIHAQKIVPAAIEFVDIAGLVKGAAKGEGLGNQFLGHIRDTDAIVHVVRCFDSNEIVHVEGSVDPLRDIGIIESELIFADSETISTNLSRFKKALKSGRKDLPGIIAMLEALETHIQGLKPVRTFNLAPFIGDHIEVAHAFRDLHLITAKKTMYVLNVDEDLASGEKDNKYTKLVKEHASKEGACAIVVSSKIEEELSDLDPESKMEMIKDLGMEMPGLDRLIQAGYDLLGLLTYFTAGKKEIHAWTIQKGDKAPVAAGKIHSDFEKGFICAEIYSLLDLQKFGSREKLKEQGLIRQEGREYIVRDGDIIEFRFNV